MEPFPPISAIQARLALLEAGLLADVEMAVASNPATFLAWEYATQIDRDSPILAAVASELGLTQDQVDALFRRALAL